MEGKPGGDGLPYWPISAAELAPWYSLVERKLRLRGGASETGVELTEIIEPSPPEREIERRLKARRPGATPRMGSHAAPPPWLDLAHAAGRLTCRGGAVVRRILIDKSGRAEGAEWFDCDSGRIVKASAPLVFLCASAIESTRILMLSAGKPGAEPVGLHSPALGRYLMDHAKISGGGFARNLPGMAEQKGEPGRSIYVPTYGPEGTAFGLQVHVHPRSEGEVRVEVVSFAEILPEADNRVELDPSRLDAYGMPVPNIRLRFSEAQRAAGKQQIEVVRQIFDDLELKQVTCSTELAAPGTAVHESGTARMGTNPETSVVDPNNECWDVKGLYVTDGACFPRVSLQNPTLAIMALTARAAEHAVASVAAKPPADVQVIRQSFAQPSASSVPDTVARG
jgi:choline dehydrogenase-like flavoprotein